METAFIAFDIDHAVLDDTFAASHFRRRGAGTGSEWVCDTIHRDIVAGSLRGHNIVYREISGLP